MDIIQHACFGSIVGQQEIDGYINISKLSKAYQEKTSVRRDSNHWLALKRTKASIDHLSSVTGITVSLLVVVRKGNFSDLEQGTWIHPMLAVRFGIWLSDEFGYMVETWFQQWSTRQSELRLEAKFESRLTEIELKLEAGFESKLTEIESRFETQLAEFKPQLIEEVHDRLAERLNDRIGALTRNINEAFNAQSGEITKQVLIIRARLDAIMPEQKDFELLGKSLYRQDILERHPVYVDLSRQIDRVLDRLKELEQDLKVKDYRKQIYIKVARFCGEDADYRKNVWNQMYQELVDRSGVNVFALAKDLKCTCIDVIEAEGLLTDLYQIAFQFLQ